MNSELPPKKPGPLPPFRAVTPEDMRRLWVSQPDADVRRLLLELERTRRAIAHIQVLAEAIDRAWKREIGGEQSALFELRQVLKTERYRGILDIVPYPNVPNY